jgi:transcriptional regulator with XRE-family HTH domain
MATQASYKVAAVMTSQRLSTLLDEVGWSVNELSRRLDIRQQTIRRWLAGSAPIPDRIDAWLEEVARIIATIPPPP